MEGVPLSELIERIERVVGVVRVRTETGVILWVNDGPLAYRVYHGATQFRLEMVPLGSDVQYVLSFNGDTVATGGQNTSEVADLVEAIQLQVGLLLGLDNSPEEE
jgi:hypothetical protein